MCVSSARRLRLLDDGGFIVVVLLCFVGGVCGICDGKGGETDGMDNNFTGRGKDRRVAVVVALVVVVVVVVAEAGGARRRAEGGAFVS